MKVHITVSILATLLVLGHLPVLAGNGQPPDPAKLIYVLRTAKVFRADQAANAQLNHKQATIFTKRNPKASDKDCKIDAVLIAKELIKSFPEDISRVRILFEKPGTNKADQVDVTTGDVKAYSLGAMGADDLLSSLELTEVDYGEGSGATKALSVVPGPMSDKRLMLLSRIEALKLKGTSVKPFQDIFNKIESETSSVSEDVLKKDIAYLAEKITDQEKLVKQITLRAVKPAGGAATRPIEVAAPAAASPADASEINRRCDVWDNKIKQWQGEGRDVTQLHYSIAIVRMLLGQNKVAEARNSLEAMDHLLSEGPPRN